ncbi:hypothetical protein KY328_02375 [Candidatus Woesearchaeota archaeon]|nr:hypothetical protein [Candidatus Woesearchaeota archaeon]
MPEELIKSKITGESYTPLTEYGSVSVGDFYNVKSSTLPVKGTVKVTDIRRWSDGKVEVHLRELTNIEGVVLAELFDTSDPRTGEPIFEKVQLQ